MVRLTRLQCAFLVFAVKPSNLLTDGFTQPFSQLNASWFLRQHRATIESFASRVDGYSTALKESTQKVVDDLSDGTQRVIDDLSDGRPWDTVILESTKMVIDGTQKLFGIPTSTPTREPKLSTEGGGRLG